MYAGRWMQVGEVLHARILTRRVLRGTDKKRRATCPSSRVDIWLFKAMLLQSKSAPTLAGPQAGAPIECKKAETFSGVAARDQIVGATVTLPRPKTQGPLGDFASGNLGPSLRTALIRIGDVVYRACRPACRGSTVMVVSIFPAPSRSRRRSPQRWLSPAFPPPSPISQAFFLLCVFAFCLVLFFYCTSSISPLPKDAK